MSNNDRGKSYADMDPSVKNLLPDSESFEDEQDVVEYLTRNAKLFMPSSPALEEGGTLSEVLARSMMELNAPRRNPDAQRKEDNKDMAHCTELHESERQGGSLEALV
jgi:hypothetical protein